MTKEERMDQEAFDMIRNRNEGKAPKISQGCVHQTIAIGAKHMNQLPDPDELPKVPFADYELQERAPINWKNIFAKILRNVAAPILVGMIFFVGVLRGDVTEDFGLPISWACSLISVFFAGVIVARAQK